MAQQICKAIAMAATTFMIVGVANASDKSKAEFDVSALQTAMKSSEKDHNKTSDKASKYRDQRATASTRTGSGRVKMRVTAFGGTGSGRNLRSPSKLRGLGESKELIVKDSIEIDFDSELKEVDVDPAEQKAKQ